MKPIVLITGATGGIGAATVEAFSSAGWYTIGVDCVRPEKTTRPDRFIDADLSKIEAIQALCKDINQHEGTLQALVNNAAVQVEKSLVETEPHEWDTVMSVNVRAAFLTLKWTYPMLIKRGGTVVNVSSVHAIATSENLAAYATSKGALVALTRAAALEMAKDNIRVNAVLPGAVDTNMLQSGLTRAHLSGKTAKDRLEELCCKHALGRVGKPSEIAETILFLSDSSKSAFITGQALIVDGGATARLSTE